MNLNEADLAYLSSFKITKEMVFYQLGLLRKGPKYLHLIRPLTKENGIKTLSESDRIKYLRIYEQALSKVSPVKFVPASGAASRMFEDLIKANCFQGDINALFSIRHNITMEDYLANTFYFFENLDKFALYDELNKIFERDGLKLRKAIADGDLKTILKKILEENGLNYINIPKALIKFHRYLENEIRTPAEEHLVEGAYYSTGKDNICRMHFTVSHSKTELFRRFLEGIKVTYEHKFGCKYDIEISEQDPSTNTVALDEYGELVRDEQGRILLRPGGHGSLLGNLQKISASVIFIKNIDNVCHDHMKPEVVLWKKILGGILIELKEKVNGYIRGLKEGSVGLEEANSFLRDELKLRFSSKELDNTTAKEAILKALKRPIRVCGVVKNVSEPGGAPFWVRDKDGRETPQIVEKAQVDFTDKAQREIFESAEYFNPVDIVCSIHDEGERPYDLKKFSDEEAYVVSHKQYQGKTIRILEYPGLWNGRMAHWLTLFVEVPRNTFFPVKKISDLLKYGHMPKYK